MHTPPPQKKHSARTDAWVARQRPDLSLVVVCQARGRVLVPPLGHVVGLDGGGVDREAGAHVLWVGVGGCRVGELWRSGVSGVTTRQGERAWGVGGGGGGGGGGRPDGGAHDAHAPPPPPTPTPPTHTHTHLRRLERVLVDACDDHLLPRPHAIHQVVQQDDLLGARQPPRGHRPRRLLQRHLLVVAVERLLHIQLRSQRGGGGERVCEGAEVRCSVSFTFSCARVSVVVACARLVEGTRTQHTRHTPCAPPGSSRGPRRRGSSQA